MAEGINTELAPALVSLSKLLLADLELPALLTEIAYIAHDSIAGADGASLRIPQVGAPDLVAGSTSTALQLQQLQQELAEGPALAAASDRVPASSGSLASDRRWPRFGARAGRAGIHSALSFALPGSDPVGSITLYGHSRNTFGQAAASTAQALTEHAAAVLGNAQVIEQARRLAAKLEWSAAEGAWVERAIGILMSRRAFGPDEALASLRAQSQRQNVKLAGLAEQFVLEAVGRAKHRITAGGTTSRPPD